MTVATSATAAGTVAAEDAALPLAVAVDVGSSSVRAGLYDARRRRVRGSVVGSGYRWRAAPGGAVTVDASVVLDRVETALDRLVSRHGALLGEVRVGGLSTLFHSFVEVDRNGDPVGPALSWADTSRAEAAAELERRLDGGAVWERTGLPLHPGFWPARILASRHGRRRTRTGRRWAGLPELILRHLTGTWGTGQTLASGTGLVDRRSGGWWSELLDVLGVTPDELPPMLDERRPAGRTSAPLATRWPQLSHVEWLPPVGDGACGNIGLDATGPERAAVMVGTSAAVRVLVQEPPMVPPGLFAVRTGCGSTLLGGQLSEGGGLLAWWARLVGRPIAELDEMAAERTSELAVLPYLAGERGLGYHPSARAAIAGLGLDDDAADVFRGLMESLAISLSEVDRRLAEALPGRPRIVASGGALARSVLFPRLLADALGRPIEVSQTGEPSLRGAALLALRAAGVGDEVAPPAPGGRTFRPDLEGSARLDRLRQQRAALYRALVSGDGG